jgi:hypothetical protein
MQEKIFLKGNKEHNCHICPYNIHYTEKQCKKSGPFIIYSHTDESSPTINDDFSVLLFPTPSYVLYEWNVP